MNKNPKTFSESKQMLTEEKASPIHFTKVNIKVSKTLKNKFPFLIYS